MTWVDMASGGAEMNWRSPLKQTVVCHNHQSPPRQRVGSHPAGLTEPTLTADTNTIWPWTQCLHIAEAWMWGGHEDGE